MKTYISMLRGINVSGQKIIRMVELKNLYESLGLVDVTTYLQSGNVIFNSLDHEASNLVQLIEMKIEQSFGYHVSVFIKATQDFHRIIEQNPFLTERKEDPAKLYVTFLYRLPSALELKNLNIPDSGSDEFIIQGKEIFLFCPNGYGKTKLSNNFFEKKLNMPATTRNWNTVQALLGLTKNR